MRVGDFLATLERQGLAQTVGGTAAVRRLALTTGGKAAATTRGGRLTRRAQPTWRLSVQELYGLLYDKAKPELEKKVADKEAEIEAVLDGFGGLTPKIKDRVNVRLEALQAELDALRADLRDSRLSWDYFADQLAARKEALDRATATLNQEGQVRQKAEVLKTVVSKIVCHFRRVGKRAILDSIEVIPAEDAAIRPLTFPAASLLKDSCLCVIMSFGSTREATSAPAACVRAGPRRRRRCSRRRRRG